MACGVPGWLAATGTLWWTAWPISSAAEKMEARGDVGPHTGSSEVEAIADVVRNDEDDASGELCALSIGARSRPSIRRDTLQYNGSRRHDHLHAGHLLGAYCVTDRTDVDRRALRNVDRHAVSGTDHAPAPLASDPTLLDGDLSADEQALRDSSSSKAVLPTYQLG